MQTKSILKILLMSVNFENFVSINLWLDQSHSSVSSAVVGYVYRYEFLKVNDFVNLTWFAYLVCISYPLCEICKIIECNFLLSV